jgi:hypothetical protein
MPTEFEPSSLDGCKKEAHYWIIDDKNLGVCKRCGARKQFAVDRWVWQRRKLIITKDKADR